MRLQGWGAGILAYLLLAWTETVLSEGLAFWLSTLMLAFCLGAFWGAGEVRRRDREAAERHHNHQSAA